jgi:hypothetical protein
VNYIDKQIEPEKRYIVFSSGPISSSAGNAYGIFTESDSYLQKCPKGSTYGYYPKHPNELAVEGWCKSNGSD